MPPGIASGAHKPMGFQGAKRRNDGKSVRRKAVDMGTRCDIIEAYRCIKRDRERERERKRGERGKRGERWLGETWDIYFQIPHVVPLRNPTKV